MTVAELIEVLKTYPSEWKVQLTHVIRVGNSAHFDEVLDSPIIGAAGHPAGDVRLVTERDGNVASLGRVERFPP